MAANKKVGVTTLDSNTGVLSNDLIKQNAKQIIEDPTQVEELGGSYEAYQRMSLAFKNKAFDSAKDLSFLTGEERKGLLSAFEMIENATKENAIAGTLSERDILNGMTTGKNLYAAAAASGPEVLKKFTMHFSKYIGNF